MKGPTLKLTGRLLLVMRPYDNKLGQTQLLPVALSAG
jgi:hypothetical protein